MKSRAYHDYKNLVEEHILDYIPKIDPNSITLYESMKYSLTAGGKRIRPVLMLACAEMAGASTEFSLPFAIAAEYIQTYSLIHDDLPAMDNDDYRRGMLTNHKVYGEDIAILTGDGLLSAAYEVITKDMLLYLDNPEKLNCKVRAAYALSKGTGCRGMVAGQIADVEAEHKKATAEMVNFIHSNKTAAFILSCIRAGAFLGNADKALLDDLTKYGECVGIAFQIVDDIQDVIGTKDSRGKRVGGDAENEKATYPAVYGLEKSIEKANELLDEASDAVSKYYDEAELLNDLVDYLRSMIK